MSSVVSNLQRETALNMDGAGVALTPENIRISRLIEAMEQIPEEISLTPTFHKAPVRPGWNTENKLSHGQLRRLLSKGEWIEKNGQRYFQAYNGYAIRTGSGLVVIDLDGKSAIYKAFELFGGQPPKTPTWQGAKGKSLLYRLPQDLSDRLAASHISISKLKIVEDCLRGEQIELLYSGKSATIPPSWHPRTDDGYQWILDFSQPIAEAPKWVCAAFEAEIEKKNRFKDLLIESVSEGEISTDYIQQLLRQIDPECDYETWINTGYAIKKLSPDLDGLDLWQGWSQQSSKSRSGDCDKRWDGLVNPRLGLNYLKRLAGLPLSSLNTSEGGKSTDAPNPSTREWAIAQQLFNFNQVLPLIEKDYKITHKEDAQRDVAYYPERTPEFSQALIDGVAKTILIRGFLAAGKTYAAIESLKRMVAALGTDQQFVWISTRNGLLKQSEARLLSKDLGIPIYFFQSDVKLHRRLMEVGQPGIFIMTDASFSAYHVGRVDWSNISVIVDEWASVRGQIPSKAKCFPEFKRMLSDARVVVALDAFLGDVDCRILTKFREGDRLILDQVLVKAPKNIRWAECRTADGEISFSHDGMGLRVFDSWFTGRSLSENERYILVTDSLLTANVMKLYAMKEHGFEESEVLLICSQTVEENHRTMPDPDGRIRESGAKLVILTPTAESGLDIQIPFTAGLAMFCGVLSGTGAMQLMGRARGCDDWIVSAPRRSINPDQPHLSENKIKRILARLGDTLEESGTSGDARSDGWAVWEREIKVVRSAFNSQYIYHLLNEHYEFVTTIEGFNSDSQRWRGLVYEVKALEAVKALTADLKNGLLMVEEETPPSKDQHVWDITLAKGYTEHPKLWAAAIADYHSGNLEKREDTIACAKAMLKEKELTSLKRYVQAGDCDLDDDNALNDRVARVGSSYASPAFKQLQNQSLFRTLNLESLAQMNFGDKVEAHMVDVAAFDARSPRIQALWKKFKSISRLVRLFPAVETVQDFWRAIKAAMRYFGFQAQSGTARAEREGKKPSLYFVGWLIRAESGSKFFVQNFDLIIESVRDRLEVERLKRKQSGTHTLDSGQQSKIAA